MGSKECENSPVEVDIRSARVNHHPNAFLEGLALARTSFVIVSISWRVRLGQLEFFDNIRSRNKLLMPAVTIVSHLRNMQSTFR